MHVGPDPPPVGHVGADPPAVRHAGGRSAGGGARGGPIHRRWGMRGADPPPVEHAGGVEAPPSLLVQGSPGGSTRPGTSGLPAAPFEGNSRLANGSRACVPMLSHLTSSRVRREVRRIRARARSPTHLRAASNLGMGDTLVPLTSRQSGSSWDEEGRGGLHAPHVPHRRWIMSHVPHRRWLGLLCAPPPADRPRPACPTAGGSPPTCPTGAPVGPPHL